MVESGTPGLAHLVSPSGVKLAAFRSVYGQTAPIIRLLVDGLVCREDYKTAEHAVKDLVDQHEKPKTRNEQARRRISGFFTHGSWVAVGAIAVVVTAIIGFLVYIAAA